MTHQKILSMPFASQPGGANQDVASQLPMLQAMESHPDGILLEEDGAVLFSNQAAAEMLGFGRAEELLQRDLDELLPHRNRDDRNHDDSVSQTRVSAEQLSGATAAGESLEHESNNCHDLKMSASCFPVLLPEHSLTMHWLPRASAANARQMPRELKEAQTRLQLYKNVSWEMNSGMAVAQIIEHTLAETQRNFPFLRISYWSASGPTKMTAVHSVGCDSLPAIKGYELDLARGSELQCQLQQGKAVVIADVVTDERTQGMREDFIKTGTRAILVIPVLDSRNELSFVCYGAAEVHEWTEYELATLADMSEYLAIAKRQAHSQEERLKVEQLLRESQKMEAVGQLVGGIAHDFNNLLTAMMIYTGLLSTALGKEHRLHGHVDEIRQAGERGANLVAQLLALTKQQVLEPTVLTIDAVVSGMRDMLQRMIGEDVVLLTCFEEGLKSTRVDQAQLEQVILNLAINARDAMPSGGRLNIECTNVLLEDREAEEQELPPGEYVQLLISDTGHGMDAETMSHIFEPFFTTKEVGKGTGLGLATAYGIVKQHGGTISVTSKPAKGASFRILLPSVFSEDESLDDDTEAIALPEPTGGLETVLLVEDEDLVRKSLVETLRLSGYEVLAASGGAEALDWSDRHKGPIPLLITDLVMPGMNGRQVADAITERRPGMAVLYMSGYTDDPRTRKMLGEGVDFFRKPFSSAALVQKVRDVLDRERQPKSSRVAVFPANGRDSITEENVGKLQPKRVGAGDKAPSANMAGVHTKTVPINRG